MSAACQIEGCGAALYFPEYAVVVLDDGRRVIVCRACMMKIRKELRA